MDISIFLAKIVGLLLIVVATSLIINTSMYKNFFKEMNKDTYKDHLQLFFMWFISFIVGMIVVLKHNLWELNWFVIITILWYLAIIKWISLIVFPNKTLSITNKLKINKKLLKIIWTIYLIIWLYITYLWYF